MSSRVVRISCILERYEVNSIGWLCELIRQYFIFFSYWVRVPNFYLIKLIFRFRLGVGV